MNVHVPCMASMLIFYYYKIKSHARFYTLDLYWFSIHYIHEISTICFYEMAIKVYKMLGPLLG